MTYILHLIITSAMFIPVTLGYNFVFGRGKILHFGPTGLSVIVAYALYLTQKEANSFLMGIAVAIFVACIFSLFFAWLALRLDADAFGILTLACHLGAIAVILNWTSLTRGALGIAQIPRMTGMQSMESFAIVTVIVAILWILFMMRVDRSSLGRALVALAENRVHAESLGLSRGYVYVQAFLILGIGTVLSTIFFPQYISLLHPNDYGFHALVFYIMCIVAGKPGSVLGVTLSLVLLTILKEGLRFLPLSPGFVGPLRLVLFGMILLIAVYIRRNEIFPKRRTV
jgi:branched-chain amino acid transport system permease protein